MELNISRNYKDVIFIDLFEHDKKSLLELFNFFNGTDFTDESEIDIVTIRDSLFVTKYNDLAFIFANVISLYEHQSTLNANLPLRLLCYLAEEYQMIAGKNENSVYRNKRIMLPTPKMFIFYNGKRNAGDLLTMRLSDSYANKDIVPDLDLSATFVNINYGHNEELMTKCRQLKEYSLFVDRVRNDAKEGNTLNESLNAVINDCISNGILTQYLTERRDFVLGSLIREFDQEKYDKTLKLEGYEEGQQALLEKLVKNGKLTETEAISEGYVPATK